MSGRRIFSNGNDTTYNNYYNCKSVFMINSTKPPITIAQAATSFIHNNNNAESSQKFCANGNRIYPRGLYLNEPVRSSVHHPPLLPLGDQAFLEYGAGVPSLTDENCDEKSFHTIPDMCSSHHLGESFEAHLFDSSHNNEKERCQKEIQIEMELLKNYRFKCYQCINPCCPANVIALQMIRDARNNKTGTTTTTMTYGSTGTTTTTTTTVSV